MHQDFFELANRRKFIPKNAKSSLCDPGKESRGEGQPTVHIRVGDRINLVLQQSPQQQRHYSNGPNGCIPRAPHQRVDQRWDEA